MPNDRLGIVAEFGEQVMASIISRFTAFSPLTPDDLEDLARLATGRRSLKRGEAISRQGEPSPGLFLVLRGWVASSAIFANGATQLVNIYLTGDMVGTTDLALRRCAQSAVALTPVELSVISRHEVGLLFERSPRLAALLFMISQEERVMLMDRLASIGSTKAASRLAALLLQVHARVVRAQPGTGDAFDFPLLQSDVADMIGVTAVHLNRTAQALRAAKLLTWKRQRITIHDFPAMIRLAELPRRVVDSDPSWLPRETADP